MPWRLIGFLTILTLFLIFAGFNTQLVTINFGPLKIENIPMFVSLFFSFLAGAFIAVPFSLLSSAKKRKQKEEKINSTSQKTIEKSVEQTESPQEIEGNNQGDEPTLKREKKKGVKKSKKKGP
jgi:uncharacterized integral membrane protein